MTKSALNPQGEQMADESMVRNLASQAEAIWPQESALFRAYGLAGDLKILDVGCGDRKSTRLNSSHYSPSRMPSSA